MQLNMSIEDLFQSIIPCLPIIIEVNFYSSWKTVLGHDANPLRGTTWFEQKYKDFCLDFSGSDEDQILKRGPHFLLVTSAVGIV
jgi:hypothetical protein